MKQNKCTIPAAVLSATLYFAGCVFVGDPEKMDSCSIKAFGPKQLVADSEITISATIFYELNTSDSAELFIGFNTNNPNEMTVYETGQIKLYNGSGKIYWTGKTIPRIWGNGECFKIYMMFTPVKNDPKLAIDQLECFEVSNNVGRAI